MSSGPRSKPAPAPAAPDEGALRARLRAGDEAAFEALVATTSPRLLATLRRMLSMSC